VTAAWSWTQYPASPSETEASEVPDGFVGRNAIVWTGEGAFDEFVVHTISKGVITANRDIDKNGTCHFTLDSASSNTNQPLESEEQYHTDYDDGRNSRDDYEAWPCSASVVQSSTGKIFW
jgi:hypothetical protein